LLCCVRSCIAGHDRFITTGPHWTLAGAQEQLSLSYGINEETIPHPGTLHYQTHLQHRSFNGLLLVCVFVAFLCCIISDSQTAHGANVRMHAGAGLYGMTKGLGLEIARVYSAFYPINVICHLYNAIGIAPEPG